MENLRKLKNLLLSKDFYLILILLVISFWLLSLNDLFSIIIILIVLCFFSYFIIKHNIKLFFIYIVIIIIIAINLFINNLKYQHQLEYFENHNYIIEDISLVVHVSLIDNYQKIKIKYQSFYYYCYLFDEDRLENIKPGTVIKIKGTLELPKAEELTGGFNYQKYLYYEKIIGIINLSQIKVIKNIIHYNLINFYISRYYDKFFDSLSSSYLKALLLGDKSALETDLKDSINSIGISHLFVVSGLHVSIIVLIIASICSKFKVNKIMEQVLTIIILFIYLVITSFLISVIRVFLGQILKFLNKDNKILTFNLFCINIIIAMILFPLKVFSLSFILTYLISGTIILSKQILKNKKNIVQMFLISIISTLITLPLILSISGSINILSIIYNLFYIPIVTYLILPSSIIVSFLPFLNIIYRYLIICFNFLINVNSKIIFGKIIFHSFNTVSILIYYFLLYLLLNKYELKKLTNNKKLAVVFLIFLLILKNINMFIFNFEISFLNIGLGDSTLIMYPNNSLNILVDTGEESEILTYLKKRGICRLDYLIISHGDSDHNAQLKNIVEEISVRNIIISRYDEITKNEINKLYIKPNVIVIKNTGIYKLNDAVINVLGPMKNYGNTNDNSLVFIMHINNFKILFTGDISSVVEKELLSKYQINVDIFKIAHHGSKYSSCSEFINGIIFKYAVAMNGYDNQFGFPNKEIIERFSGKILLNTNDFKTITFKKGLFDKTFYLKSKKT